MELHYKSDQELINLYNKGDQSALEELIHRHKTKISTSIYLMVQDSSLAEDIFQDTFLKIINTLRAGKYNEEGKFLPWAIRIAHNLAIDHFRREKRSPFTSLTDQHEFYDSLTTYEESVEDRIIREQTYQHLRGLIQLLPDEQKEVLLMRHYGKMSFRDIAEITEVSINTALGRMRYAITNLRKMMNTEFILKAGY
jgi:RNA polymerase sigma-70 factor (ECF subfamily)